MNFKLIKRKLRFWFFDTFGKRVIERTPPAHGDWKETCGWYFNNKFYPCEQEEVIMGKIDLSDIPYPLFGSPVSPWRKYFAWRPIKTWDNRFVWMRNVNRRLIQKHIYLDGGNDFWFQYHYNSGYIKE